MEEVKIKREGDVFEEIVLLMNKEELERMLDASAERGANLALKRVGLSDEDAGADIKTIRDLLNGFRIFKKEAWTVTIAGVGKIVGWAVVLGIGALLFKSGGQTGQHIAQKILEP